MISAIVSTYNRAHFLPILFDSIASQSVDFEQYEVVIVNNNCTDNTEEVCQKFMIDHPKIQTTYCIETSQGLSFGRNRGIAESKGDLVTFLDDDAFLAPDFFEKTLSFFQNHPGINAIGGKILLHYMKEKPAWFNPFMSSLLGYFNCGDKEKVFTNTYFRGSNMSFRKSLFDKYDGFNILLGRVGKQLYGNEEKELFYRLKSKGEEMWYVPSTVVYHLVPIERTYSEFIKRQAIGTGISQRQHAQIKGKISVFVGIIAELMKWGATLILFIFYFLTFRVPVAIMLLKFRFWVSQGILLKKG